MSLHEIKCMIVDDEPLAIRVIETHLNKVPDVVIKATCRSALEAIQVVQRQSIDLVFLDIQMPELTGIDFIKSLEHPPSVIFTTAHREFAVEGFELDVVDYVLKPVSLPRLLRALEKYRRQFAEIGSSTPQGADSLVLSVRSNRKTVRISIETIDFIESLSDYVKIHTNGKPIVCKERISRMAEKLEPEGFIRIHRSFLVPVAKISSFSTDEVVIKGQSLPVSRSYRNQVKLYLGRS